MGVRVESPSSDVGGTTVVVVRSSDLRRFIVTIEDCHRRGYGLDRGIFKMKIDGADKGGGTSLEHLLSLLNESIDDACVMQEFRRYPLSRDVYGYKGLTPIVKSHVSHFSQRLKSATSYLPSGETCCSRILCHPDRDVTDVVLHYFGAIETCSVFKSSGRSLWMEDRLADCERLMEVGARLKAEYAANILHSTSQLQSPPSRDKAVQRTIHLRTCECEDCFSESEPEEDSSHCGLDNSGLSHLSHVGIEETDSLFLLEKNPKYSCGILLANNPVEVVDGFGMSDIYSVLNVLPQRYRCLQHSHFDVGEEHSTFVAHCENSSLYLASYVHFGFPTVWITIPPSHHDTVATLLRQERMELAHTSCFNSLNHKYYLPTLLFLKRQNIPHHITVQHCYEFVILYPNTIYFGFHMGPNISESVNFGTVSWILEGVKAMKWRCRCFGDLAVHLPMRLLVASFFPEEMEGLFGPHPDRKVVASECGRQQEKHREDHALLKGRKVKVFSCPDPDCSASYREHRHRLKAHVTSKHVGNAGKYLNQINALYPQADVGKKSCRQCPVCCTFISGSVNHLEYHMAWQARNPKLSVSKRKEYEVALLYLQGGIRRRKKSKEKELS